MRKELKMCRNANIRKVNNYSIGNLLGLYSILFFFIIISSILSFSFTVFLVQLFLATITIPFINKKSHEMIRLYILIYAISIIFIFVVYSSYESYYGLPYYLGGSDDLSYEKWGYDVYNSNMYNPSKILKSGVLDQFHSSPFFVVYISLLIRLANMFDGYSTFIPRIVNVYFLLWICIILEHLLKKYAKFDNKKIYMTIAIFTLMPNIQYINSHVFRDTFNLFQIFFIIYLVDKSFLCKIKIKNILYIITLFFMLYITYYTRKNSIAFAAAIILLMIFDKIRYKKTYIIILTLLLIMLSGSILKVFNINYFIETYSNYVSNLAGEGMSNFIFSQKLLPFGIFFRAIYGLIIPFPNFFSLFNSMDKLLYDIIYLFIYSGVILQVLFIPFIVKRIFKLDFLSLSFLTFYMGVIITTFTFRHVILYYPFMAAIVVDGYMTSSKGEKTQYMTLSLFLGISLGLIYMVIKIFG